MTTLNYKLEPINAIEMESVLGIETNVDELELEIEYEYEGAFDGGREEPSYPASVDIGEIKVISYLTGNKLVKGIPEQVNDALILLITPEELEKIEAACFEDVEEHNSNMLLDSLINEIDPPFDDYY